MDVRGARSSPHRSFYFLFFFLRGKRADQRRRVKLTRCMAWGEGRTWDVGGQAPRHTHGERVRGCCTAARHGACVPVCRRALADWQGDGSWTHRRAEQPTLTPTQLRVSSTLPDPGAQPQVGLELIPTSRADCSRPSSPSIVDSPPLNLEGDDAYSCWERKLPETA